MPYITEERRQWFDPTIDNLVIAMEDEDAGEGDLNYIVTRIVHEWLGDKPNYAKFNTAMGVLECAKLELYRRLVAPYEDTKIAANGDVP